MSKFKWVKKNILLRRLEDGMFIPWPPQENEGFKAKIEIDSGEIPEDEDPPSPEKDPAKLDDNDRAIQAMAAVVAEYTGKPAGQVRADFERHYKELPNARSTGPEKLPD